MTGSADHPLPPWADPAVAEGDLDPQGVSRRGLLRRAGQLGAGVAVVATAGGAGVLATSDPAAAHHSAPDADCPDLMYLVGDHHVHSVFSHDAKYRPADAARRGAQFGLDWMVFTEHSNVGHADAGGAVQQREHILAARAENPRMLIFQGLEWYIPAAEHATVFTCPGPNEAEVLRQFETRFDGKLLKRTEGAPAHPDTAGNEAVAVAAIRWLAARRRAGFVPDALVLANHPSRLGIDSPHELRAWRDADPAIMIGMEGAPGAQGAALPGLRGSTQHSRRVREQAHRPVVAGLPTGGVRDVRRLRLDDRHRRRAVGRHAVRGAALHHHQQLRQSPDGARHPAQR